MLQSSTRLGCCEVISETEIAFAFTCAKHSEYGRVNANTRIRCILVRYIMMGMPHGPNYIFVTECVGHLPLC
jgi:hypothetical protein